jgi:hypothetical protein
MEGRLLLIGSEPPGFDSVDAATPPLDPAAA